MDPFSITAGVAGIATTGAALASALFDIIASIRDAPREMIEIAHGMHELSVVLRELRRVIKKAYKLLKQQLFIAITSAMARIRDIHDRVDELLDAESGLQRVLWAFRRSKTTKLLATIESHKSTIQLMATTLTLALLQKNDISGKSKRNDSKRILRTEAETLVRATEQSLRELGPEPVQRDQGVQTDEQSQEPHLVHNSISRVDGTADTSPHLDNNQLQRWQDAPDDTAKWLYRLIFQPTQLTGLNQRIDIDNVTVPDLIAPANRVAKAPAVDSLLLQWTNLTPDEILDTAAGSNTGATSMHTDDLAKRVDLLKDDESTRQLRSLNVGRKSVHANIRRSLTMPPAGTKLNGASEVKAQRPLRQDNSNRGKTEKHQAEAEQSMRSSSTTNVKSNRFDANLAVAADYMDLARKKSGVIPTSPYGMESPHPPYPDPWPQYV